MSIDILNIPSPEWMSHPDRRCAIPKDYGPKHAGAFADYWFPTETRGVAASNLCGGCPVATECLAYAMAHPELDGIWGGTTEFARRKLRGVCGTYAGYLRHQKRGEKACRRCSMANAHAARQKRAAERKAAKDAA